MDYSIQDLMNMGSVSFVPSFRTWNYCKTNIVVVGCGGTGGRLVPTLTQHIANHNKEIARETRATNKAYLTHPFNLMLIDMDIVESKNLKRQNFYSFDIGKNKAQCLAERYSALSGISISYFSQKFSEVADNIRADNLIIFDCTDNLEARRSIENVGGRSIIISCGNEDTFGQVVVSTTSNNPITCLKENIFNLINRVIDVKDQGRTNFGSLKMKDLPTLLTMYPSFADTETASCTEIQLVNEQSMPINSLVAQLAYNAFYDIISGTPLNYNMVKCSVKNSFTTQFISNAVSALDVFIPALSGVRNTPSTVRLLHKYLSSLNLFTSRLRNTSLEAIASLIDELGYSEIEVGIYRMMKETFATSLYDSKIRSLMES
jgi:molybdopterin/thiamine biosynthesis adenylyltransferase